MDDGSSILSFVKYLKIIQSRAKSFSFAMPEGEISNNLGTKTLLGVLWMTSTMRRNYELYGSYISLDFMKRGLNKLL